VRLRITAIAMATTSTRISAVTKMNAFLPNFSRTFGNASAKTSPSKNASLMSGHPDEFRTATIAAVKNTTVLTTAIATPRTPSTRSGARMREPRSPGGRRGSTG
jgi:hypothetical protein